MAADAVIPVRLVVDQMVEADLVMAEVAAVAHYVLEWRWAAKVGILLAADWVDFAVKIGFQAQQMQSSVCFGGADRSADPAVDSIDFVELVEPVAVDIVWKLLHGMTGRHAGAVALAVD